ncbi:TetR family transcriptional regulator [Nocardiopsis sp. TSRI0078]|uniref:TetR/AcrR family transcriptional regulator n=1 Tax=unclassified Nocardiopsis TaxID=2649073 RepID=UPI00093F1F77|nr:TetR/AcrR family transcriptional regulator [Nocardiopsis sp. TSRI0078]OKI13068.1 TetR family transcriptional regulator [Nocardiopsis sp. TSRI0078]
MSEPNTPPVPADLVNAALRAAENLGKDVADVPLIAIAEEAGVSRSTLLRRVGGSRRALDEAVRASGVDPGGRLPVRERAIEAGARLISGQGLGATTLEAVAASAGCSVHSLYATFGGRDGLLRAIFERYSPILGLEEALAGPEEDLAARVHRIHRLVGRGFGREPRVLPAMLADVLTRPEGPTVDLLARSFFPRMLTGLGGWLAEEVSAGRIRDLPVPLLMQQLLGPLAVHFMLRPALGRVPGVEFPDAEEVCSVFADAFLRAVAVPEGPLRPDDPNTTLEPQ